MSGWNYIPNEILTRIIDYNEPHYKIIHTPGWESVNKQWYNIFLSKKYQSIHMQLNLNDPTVNCILKSSFCPGIWVEKIDIMEISVPRRINFKVDLLARIMDLCPRVKRVYVHSVRNDVWFYFFQVLQYTRGWNRLEALLRPTVPDDQTISVNYTNCLFLLAKSLRHLSIPVGMIDPMNCERLSNFTEVEVLEIEKNVLFDLYDCCDMISFLPKLQKVIAILSPLSLVKLYKPGQLPDKEIVKYGLTDINSLYLEDFVPTNERDLLFLMNQFPCLRNFLISGDKDMPAWPFKSKISLPVLEAFFRFIQRIDLVKIRFLVDDCSWFLEQYYEYHDSLAKRGRSNGVRVTLSNDDPRDSDIIHRSEASEYYPIYVTLEDAKVEISLEFRGAASEINTRKHILTKTNLFVTVLDIDMRSINTTEDVGHCLKIVRKYQTGLRSLKFCYGTLQEYNIKKSPHYIRDLQFEKVFIYDQGLEETMKDFPFIKQLSFDRCKFETSNQALQRFNIYMRNTDVGHLQVVYEKDPFSVSSVLFKVIQSDINPIVRYFLASVSDLKSLEEINYVYVFGSSDLSRRSDIAVFSIYCKSIKYLTFRRYRLPYQEQDKAVVSFSAQKK